MKTNITVSISALCLCMAMSSCSLFQKNVRTEAQLPSDRHGVQSDANQDPYRNQALQRGEIGGDWIIEKVLGQPAKGQDTPYLKFDPASHMAYGSNGCNTINASYRNNAADSTLSFGQMITTLRACPDADVSEAAINQALEMTARYTWSVRGDRHFLELYDAAMQPLMSLARQSFEFLNGTWNVSMIDGNKVDNDKMQLVFDMAEMKVHGNTGCNVLNGSIVTDMAHEGALSFQNMATTRMMCPDINQETALLVALEAAATVRPVNNNTVDLLSTHGNVVLRLVRAQ